MGEVKGNRKSEEGRDLRRDVGKKGVLRAKEGVTGTGDYWFKEGPKR